MAQYRVIAERPIALPPGFKAGAVAAGLKPSGKLDLALIAADRPVPCAGVFTQNVIKAAPVRYCQERLRSGAARAVCTNAGIANASTGHRGMQDALDVAECVGMVLLCDPNHVLVCSTGVIGQRLKMAAIRKHIPPLVGRLHANGFDEAATAMQTTDTRQKDVALAFELAGRTVTLVGMAKGAAMIAPNMATMLAYLFTDAAADAAALQRALTEAVEQTFNCISVDGDTSTNDTVLLFANGRAGNPTVTPDSPEYPVFAGAVREACASLARQIVLDAEGATKLVEIHVAGAANFADARHIGLTVAESPLVKTAVFGADPNYGRLIMAVGRAGVPLKESDLTLRCGEITMLRGGELVDFDAAAAKRYLEGSEVAFYVTVGAGPGAACVLTCDLTYEYVRLNAEYTT